MKRRGRFIATDSTPHQGGSSGGGDYTVALNPDTHTYYATCQLLKFAMREQQALDCRVTRTARGGNSHAEHITVHVARSIT